MTLIIFPLTGHLDSVLTVKLLITIITKGHWGGFPGSSVSKKFTCSAGDQGLIPVSVRTPGKGNGNPLQHSCLGNPMDRGALTTSMGHKELDTTDTCMHLFHIYINMFRFSTE